MVSLSCPSPRKLDHLKCEFSPGDPVPSCRSCPLSIRISLSRSRQMLLLRSRNCEQLQMTPSNLVRQLDKDPFHFPP